MSEKMTIQETLRQSLLKILQDRRLSQIELSDILNIDAGQVSRILNGKAKLTLKHLEKLSTALGLRAIDLFTYPDRYVKDEGQGDHSDVMLQLRLSKDKRDQVLKLVFGDSDIDILSK